MSSVSPDPPEDLPELLFSGPSPFPRVIALGYYDGPLSGICDWPAANQAIYFRVLAWRADRDTRLFVGFEVDRGWVERLGAMPASGLTELDAWTIDLLRRELHRPHLALVACDLSAGVDVYRLAARQAEELGNVFELTDPFGQGSADLDLWLSRLAITGTR